MNPTSPKKPAAGGQAANDDHPEVSAANAQAGLWLFFVYLAAYGGFMGLAAFAPQVMARPAIGGVNLAITYGMALIAGALIVAAVYMWFCGRNYRAVHQEGRR